MDLVGHSGPSGSGKTTLFYILGFLSCTRGYHYNFDGNDIDLNDDKLKSSLRKSKIGFVFQDKNLHDYLSVKENIKLYTLVSDQTCCDRDIKELLDKVHLNIDMNTLTGVLSGGEKQRLAIACALSKKPELIIADEPTSALDNKNRKIILDIFREIANEGKMVVIASHDEKVVNECDVIYTLKNHQIISNQRNASKERKKNKLTYSSLNKEFYQWYSAFRFGRKKIMSNMMILIPAIAISLCVFSFSLKDSLIDRYSELLDNFHANEVLIVSKAGVIDQSGLQNLSQIEGVSEAQKIVMSLVNDVTIDDKKYRLDESITIVPYFDFQKDYFDILKTYDDGDVYVSNSFINLLQETKENQIEIDSEVLTQSKYHIKGVFKKDYRLLQNDNNNCIYIPMNYFVDSNSEMAILQLNTFNDFQNISESIHKINSYYKVTFSQSQYMNQIAQVENFSDNFTLFTITLLSLSIILLIVMHFFTAMNQKYSIAVLKANGLSNSEIIHLTLVDFKNTFIKSIFCVIGLLMIEKIILYIIGMSVSLLSVKTAGLIILLTAVVYLVPYVIATFFMTHFDAEKLLRF